jgi:hypothetical protein
VADTRCFEHAWNPPWRRFACRRDHGTEPNSSGCAFTNSYKKRQIFGVFEELLVQRGPGGNQAGRSAREALTPRFKVPRRRTAGEYADRFADNGRGSSP